MPVWPNIYSLEVLSYGNTPIQTTGESGLNKMPLSLTEPGLGERCGKGVGSEVTEHYSRGFLAGGGSVRPRYAVFSASILLLYFCLPPRTRSRRTPDTWQGARRPLSRKYNFTILTNKMNQSILQHRMFIMKTQQLWNHLMQGKVVPQLVNCYWYRVTLY